MVLMRVRRCVISQAKELIMRSLPVPESVLKRHCDAIAPIFTKKRVQTIQVGPNTAATCFGEHGADPVCM